MTLAFDSEDMIATPVVVEQGLESQSNPVSEATMLAETAPNEPLNRLIYKALIFLYLYGDEVTRL